MNHRIFYSILAASLALAACMDDVDTPDVSTFSTTTQESVGEVNTSIADIKTSYSSLMSQSNAFQQIKDDLVFEGVVAANDVSGNLYQTLLLRDASGGDDQGIVLGVKNTCLYPYFAVGQRVRVNARGLYVGVYSRLPKLGEPYYTSSGNLRLGPMLFQRCQTNVQLIGTPDPACAECRPVVLDEAWLRDRSHQNTSCYPMLVTVEGTLSEADGEAIFAPDELKDAGYGVDRTLRVGATSVTIRTSTRNDIAFTVMPQGRVRLTGLLSYYSSWQVQLRSLDDIEVLE